MVNALDTLRKYGKEKITERFEAMKRNDLVPNDILTTIIRSCSKKNNLNTFRKNV